MGMFKTVHVFQLIIKFWGEGGRLVSRDEKTFHSLFLRDLFHDPAPSYGVILPIIPSKFEWMCIFTPPRFQRLNFQHPNRHSQRLIFKSWNSSSSHKSNWISQANFHQMVMINLWFLFPKCLPSSKNNFFLSKRKTFLFNFSYSLKTPKNYLIFPFFFIFFSRFFSVILWLLLTFMFHD